MKIKFGVFDKLKVFKDLIKNQTRKNITVIIRDGFGEYNFKFIMQREWHCEAYNYFIHTKL
jgi:hypothetical protein